MNKSESQIITELKDKLKYYYSRIDEINEELDYFTKKHIQTSEQTNKQTGHRRAPQGKLETWDC